MQERKKIPMNEPTCFVSYSWDGAKHRDWVRGLAEELVKNGVSIKLDQWDLAPGMDLPHYMEDSIIQSDFVLLICTPEYAKKANAQQGGVGWEKSVIAGELYNKSISINKKFIPLLKQGSSKESLPSFVKSKVYIDFQDDRIFPEKLEELLRHIYETPMFNRPKRGSKPNFPVKELPEMTMPKLTAKPKSTGSAVDKFEIFMMLFSFAKTKMGKTNTDAEIFTRQWLESIGAGSVLFGDDFCYKRFSIFEEVFDIAKTKMGKTTTDADTFATLWLNTFHPRCSVEEFLKFFDFAKTKMGKTNTDAEAYALEFLKKSVPAF